MAKTSAITEGESGNTNKSLDTQFKANEQVSKVGERMAGEGNSIARPPISEAVAQYGQQQVDAKFGTPTIEGDSSGPTDKTTKPEPKDGKIEKPEKAEKKEADKEKERQEKKDTDTEKQDNTDEPSENDKGIEKKKDTEDGDENKDSAKKNEVEENKQNDHAKTLSQQQNDEAKKEGPSEEKLFNKTLDEGGGSGTNKNHSTSRGKLGQDSLDKTSSQTDSVNDSTGLNDSKDSSGDSSTDSKESKPEAPPAGLSENGRTMHTGDLYASTNDSANSFRPQESNFGAESSQDLNLGNADNLYAGMNNASNIASRAA